MSDPLDIRFNAYDRRRPLKGTSDSSLIGPPGPAGEDGDDGREVEIQLGLTHIQWRYVGDVSWINIIAIADITGSNGLPGTPGDDGREIELQQGTTHIQWRYVGEIAWTNLIAIADITGPAGTFTGDMDDITDGSTYVKTENNLTDALLGNIHAPGSDDQVIPEDVSDLTDTSYLIAGKKPYHGVESYANLAFSNANKALTLSAITYWYKGARYTTASTVTCDLDLVADRDNSTNGLTANTLYFFYFKDATGKLYWSDTPWNFKENVFVATVFWNGSAGACQLECHSHARDLEWHMWAHDTIGTRYEDGAELTAPTTAADGSLQIETGEFHDEDLEFETGQCTTMRGWNKISANAYTFADYSLPYVGTAGQPQWLDTDDYTLKNVAASDFVRMWVYASLDIARPIYIIPTHRATAYNTLNDARNETTPVTIGTNVNSEFKLIYSFIYKGDGQFQESIDYRTTSPVPGGGTPSIAASQVTFAPSGTLSSTNVQDALTELDTEKATTAVVIAGGASGLMTGSDKTKLDGIAAGAQVNNISDVNATDLTDGGETTLHTHPAGAGGLTHSQVMSRISMGF